MTNLCTEELKRYDLYFHLVVLLLLLSTIVPTTIDLPSYVQLTSDCNIHIP